jgi:hypothetical protein
MTKNVIFLKKQFSFFSPKTHKFLLKTHNTNMAHKLYRNNLNYFNSVRSKKRSPILYYCEYFC